LIRHGFIGRLGAAEGTMTKTGIPRRPRAQESIMAAADDDDRPKKKLVHEIGQDLTLISVNEVAERVTLLKDEISRLEADMAKKRASRSVADQFFKK
jgi:uncharacterized small protein (DUF1192 family)